MIFMLIYLVPLGDNLIKLFLLKIYTLLVPSRDSIIKLFS